MERRKVAIIVWFFCSFLVCSMLSVVYGSSGNWIEVYRVEGSASPHITLGRHFVCDYPEWRIMYELDPTHLASHFPELLLRFNISIYSAEEGVIKNLVDQINLDTLDKVGIPVIHEHVGEFYMLIEARNLDNFTIMVEQNIDPIPEFPSWAPLLTMLAVILVIAGIYRYSLYKQNQRGEYH